MRIIRAAAVCLTLVVASSCTKSTSGELPTPDTLSDGLLTITDIEGDWKETQRQTFDTRGPENPSIDPSVWCTDATDATTNLIDLAGEAGADVEMETTTSEGASRMMRLQAWANDDAGRYFEDAKTAAETCDGKESVDPDSGVVFSYDLISNRSIGDESVSWVQIITPPSSADKEKRVSVGRTTIARFGSIVMVLQLGDSSFETSAQLMGEDEWWEIVETAGKKLDELEK